MGLLPHACLYLGKGIHKLIINKIKAQKNKRGLNFEHCFNHHARIYKTGCPVFAPVNVIAALEGIGLRVWILFSDMFLKKETSKPEPTGIACIVADKGRNEYLVQTAIVVTRPGFHPLFL